MSAHIELVGHTNKDLSLKIASKISGPDKIASKISGPDAVDFVPFISSEDELDHFGARELAPPEHKDVICYDPLVPNQEKVRISRNINDIATYKVATMDIHLGFEKELGAVIHEPFLAPPMRCPSSQSVILGVNHSRTQAVHLLGVSKTKFFRFLFSLGRISRCIYPENFRFIPKLDLGESWTDERLYARYGLTQDEISYIESMIKEMP